MTKIFLFSFLVLFLLSCGGIRPMSVQVVRPAKITISKEIKSIAILNRSIPAVSKTVESNLTLERKSQDNKLSEECIRGMNDLLATSDRFKIKRCEGTMNAADPKSMTFGAILPWETIDSLCQKYETEAVMVLEYFDTDFSIFNPAATAGAAIGNVLNGNGMQVEVKGTAKATAGWRVYYPKTKSIVFEDKYGWIRTWTQSAANPLDAIARLIKPNEALIDVSYTTGNQFARSIIPLYFWEDRGMYKGKKGDMERAERLALAKDWESALQLWTDVYNGSTKSKIRAKAAYNAALSCEVLGNLAEAQKWIQKAYVEKGKDEALRYSNILDQRVREQDRIEEQLSE